MPTKLEVQMSWLLWNKTVPFFFLFFFRCFDVVCDFTVHSIVCYSMFVFFLLFCFFFVYRSRGCLFSCCLLSSVWAESLLFDANMYVIFVTLRMTIPLCLRGADGRSYYVV